VYCSLAFLRINGHTLEAEEDAFFDFILRVAETRAGILGSRRGFGDTSGQNRMTDEQPEQAASWRLYSALRESKLRMMATVVKLVTWVETRSPIRAGKGRITCCNPLENGVSLQNLLPEDCTR
jgi:hypothetical protein